MFLFNMQEVLKKWKIFDQTNSFNIYVKICSILTVGVNAICLFCVFLGSISLIILILVPGVTPSQQRFERYQIILIMVSNYFNGFYNYFFLVDNWNFWNNRIIQI